MNMTEAVRTRVAQEDAANAHLLTQVRKTLASLARGMITDAEAVSLTRSDLARLNEELS